MGVGPVADDLPVLRLASRAVLRLLSYSLAVTSRAVLTASSFLHAVAHRWACSRRACSPTPPGRPPTARCSGSARYDMTVHASVA